MSQKNVMFPPSSSPTETFKSQPNRLPPDFCKIEEDLAVRVGQNLRVVRSQLGQSQQQLAERIGVSLSQYRKYESGKDLPRLHSALLWSIETGVPTHWLFHDTGYQSWLSVPFEQKWVPFLYFVNHAPSWALDAFQAVLTGTLQCHGDTAKLRSVRETRLTLGQHLLREPYYQSVAEKLRQFRCDIHLSQDEVAQFMGISTEAYRCYETPDKCTQFSINMIMRFWVATGTNPLQLSTETPVFRYRQQQRDNFQILLPLLERLGPAELEQLLSLLKALEKFPGVELATRAPLPH